MRIWEEMIKYEDMLRNMNPNLSKESVKLLSQAFMTGASTQRHADIQICKDVALSVIFGGPIQSGAVSVQILIEKTAL